jgi:parallel beta-helix repeat protein
VCFDGEAHSFQLFSYSNHDPIEISEDSEFNSTNGVVSGTGTTLDPFIIENWNITTATGHGIFIHDTLAYFVIRNCFIDVGAEYDPDGSSSICLKDTSNGTALIENNFCVGSYYGIDLYKSDFGSIINNTCYENKQGVNLWYSDYNLLLNNSFTSNSYYGIYIFSSDYISLVSNTCNSNHEGGFYIQNSHHISLVNNSCTGYGYYAINFYYSNFASLINNSCLNYQYAIHLEYSDNNFLENNSFSHNDYGIQLDNSNYTSVIDNFCSNNDQSINLETSYYNSLTNNTLSNNFIGISASASDNNIITYNSISHSTSYGIVFGSLCDNNLIHHNFFIDNGELPQALDNGVDNVWFDSEAFEGNYWSEFSGTGSYVIAGTTGSIDLFPLNEEGQAISELTNPSLFALLILNVLCLGIIIIRRK